MSSEKDKEKHSKRLHKDQSAIQKQLKIAKTNGYGNHDKVVKQPHRLAKHHSMDCGTPNCVLCSSPRKLFGEKTKQELSFDQTVKWVEE